jgi:hypothetical protein
MRGPALRIDVDALHRPQIDHHPFVAHGVAGHTVAAAVDRDRQSVLAAVVHRGNHVCRTRATRDHGGSPIDHPVEDASQPVVLQIAGPNELAREIVLQSVNCYPRHGVLLLS